MENRRSTIFLTTLGGLALLWGMVCFSLVYRAHQREGALAFSEVYFFTCLDLVALITLFWKIFYSRAVGLSKKIDLALWFVFKLVCLAFLAITLKRLMNAPSTATLLGIGFIGVGPIAAGLLSQWIAKDKI